MLDRIRTTLITVLGVAMCIYTLVAVNFETLMPESSKALFVLFGMTLCFLVYPTHKSLDNNAVGRCFDMVLALLAALVLLISWLPLPLLPRWPAAVCEDLLPDATSVLRLGWGADQTTS